MPLIDGVENKSTYLAPLCRPNGIGPTPVIPNTKKISSTRPHACLAKGCWLAALLNCLHSHSLRYLLAHKFTYQYKEHEPTPSYLHVYKYPAKRVKGH